MAEEQSAEEVLAELDALIAAAGPDADPELVATADALRVSLSRSRPRPHSTWLRVRARV